MVDCHNEAYILGTGGGDGMEWNKVLGLSPSVLGGGTP